MIIIPFASYTANLAAFLTISAIGDYVGSIMDETIAIQTRVACGHPALTRMIFQLVGLLVRIPSCLTVVYA